MTDDEETTRQLDARIVELEVKLGFAEDLIDALNRQVFRQGEQIEALRRQLIDLQRQSQNPAGERAINPRDEIPPHY